MEKVPDGKKGLPLEPRAARSLGGFAATGGVQEGKGEGGEEGHVASPFTTTKSDFVAL